MDKSVTVGDLTFTIRIATFDDYGLYYSIDTTCTDKEKALLMSEDACSEDVYAYKHIL